MHEIISSLSEQSFLLDLGSGRGSFDKTLSRGAVIRVDVEGGAAAGESLILADAAALPFRAGFFDAVVSNHSLEHFRDLDGALREIGRVVKNTGALYVAVPDSTSLCDRLYRWLGRGGGHVNRFSDPRTLVARIEQSTSLMHVATRFLLTSISFLNPRNRKARPPRKLLLLGGGNELILVLLSGLLRLVDRITRTGLAVYGWAMYFGEFSVPVAAEAWANVCARCGSGHPSDWLERSGHTRWMGLLYRCPQCRALNFFTPDTAYRHLTCARRAP